MGIFEQLDVLTRKAKTPEETVRILQAAADLSWRTGKFDDFAECFRRAYVMTPTPDFLYRGEPDPNSPATAAVLRDKCLVLLERGLAFSAVFLTLAKAQAALGNEVEAKRLLDVGLIEQGILEPPAGMTLADFNTALAAELREDMRWYDTPNDRAIRHGWRFEKIERSDKPMLTALRKQLAKHVKDYISRLPVDPTHPFLASKRPEISIVGWAVISSADSYHISHIHPCAWVNGVYYVVEPPVAATTENHAGWLEICPPVGMVPAVADRLERKFIPPTAGSIFCIPAHYSHATQPLGVKQERMCIAFEVLHPEFNAADIVYES